MEKDSVSTGGIVPQSEQSNKGARSCGEGIDLGDGEVIDLGDGSFSIGQAPRSRRPKMSGLALKGTLVAAIWRLRS